MLGSWVRLLQIHYLRAAAVWEVASKLEISRKAGGGHQEPDKPVHKSQSDGATCFEDVSGCFGGHQLLKIDK